MSTVTPRRVTPVDAGSSPRLLELLPSFRRHLAAENKAPRTLKAYSEAVSRLHDFLSAAGMPTAVTSITREHVEKFHGRPAGSSPGLECPVAVRVPQAVLSLVPG
jgi:hypothetical protein